MVRYSRNRFGESPVSRRSPTRISRTTVVGSRPRKSHRIASTSASGSSRPSSMLQSIWCMSIRSYWYYSPAWLSPAAIDSDALPI